MKKVICVLLVCMLSLGSIWMNADVFVYSAEEFSVSYNEDYALPGDTLSVNVEGAELGECTYTWYRDDVEITSAANQSSYTLADSDMQKLIKVEVSNGSETKSVQMLISRLPVVYIDIENGAEVVEKDTYLDAEIKIQTNAAYAHLGKQYEGKTEIKGRGNSTWGLPKKPYRMKFDKKSDVLGMGKNKHWVLLANYYDTSLVRNTLAYNLAAAMDMTYTATIHVDVVINGTKRGNYQLCEHIRIDDTRVDIFDWESFAEDSAETIAEAEGMDEDTMDELSEYMVEHLNFITTGTVTFNGNNYNLADYDIEIPEMNGGFLIEMDEQMDEKSCFRTEDLYQPIMFKSPEFIKTNSDMWSYVQNLFNSFEDAIQNKETFTTTYQGKEAHYTDIFDMDALIDYWIIQEVFFNQDGVRRSTYMYQDLDGKMTMGPVWDFDWSSGGMGEVHATDQWFTWYHNNYQQKDQWYKFLVKDPYYLTLAYERYQEVKPLLETMITTEMDTYKQLLNESAQENKNIWGTGGFEKNFEALRTWLTSHITWLNNQFKDKETFMQSIASINSNAFDVTMRYTKGNQALKNADATLAYHSNLTLSTTSEDIIVVFVNGKRASTIQPNGSCELSYDKVIQNQDDINVITLAPIQEGVIDMSQATTRTIINEEAYPMGISIAEGYKDTYLMGTEALDIDQIQVLLHMSDGTSEDITTEATITGFDASEVQTITMQASYQGLQAAFNIQIIEPKITYFEVDATQSYDIRDTFDQENLTIIAHYENNITRDITDKVNVEVPSEFIETGEQQIPFTYHEYKGTIDIIVHQQSLLMEMLQKVKDDFETYESSYNIIMKDKVEAIIQQTNATLENGTWQDIDEMIEILDEFIDDMQGVNRVTNLQAEAYDYKTIHLTWDYVKGANRFKIYRYNGETKKWIAFKTVNTNEATIEGVKTGVNYSYRVLAMKVFDDGAMIQGKSSSTQSCATQLYGDVTLQLKKNGNTKFDLSWNKIDGATRYIIYRKKAGESYKKVLTLGNVNTYTTSSMAPGTYFYMVKAARYDSVDRVMSEASNEVSATSKYIAPTLTITKNSTSSLKLTWNQVEGVKYYEIYRATTKNGTYKKLKTTTDTTYINTSLSKNKTYYYKVRGYKSTTDGKVYSPYSTIKHYQL